MKMQSEKQLSWIGNFYASMIPASGTMKVDGEKFKYCFAKDTAAAVHSGYALSIALSAVSFILWWMIIGISINDNRVFYWLIFNSILLVAIQPYLMRVSRTGWLAFFVQYDKNWRVNSPKALERNNTNHEFMV